MTSTWLSLTLNLLNMSECVSDSAVMKAPGSNGAQNGSRGAASSHCLILRPIARTRGRGRLGSRGSGDGLAGQVGGHAQPELENTMIISQR